MTVKTNKVILNTVGGELSPLLYGRTDLAVFGKGMSKMENFIALPQGGARYRNGTSFVNYTRLNQTAVFIPFQFSDQQSYLIEATNQKFRFYKDNSAITEAPLTVTGITVANPAVFTTAGAHGYAIGDQVYITGIAGTASSINTKFYLIAAAGFGATTFSLTDIFGNVVSTLGKTVTAPGSVARIYEISTPYYEADLPFLQFAQNADTMYITHRNYPPQKLVRSGHANWAIGPFARTADPFGGTPRAVTAITKANPGVFTTAAAHNLIVGELISLGIGGAAGDWAPVLNGANNLGRLFTVNTITPTTFTLKDPVTGAVIDTSAVVSAYTASSAKIDYLGDWPRCVAFTDAGRLIYANTFNNPQTIWASQAPTTGAPNYDVFTAGTLATSPVVFTLASIQGKVDTIMWIANTNKFVTIGTFGTIRRLYGSTEEQAFTVTDVNAKAVNAFGTAQTLPVSNGESLFYVQRGARVIRSLEFDITIDAYTTIDRNLVTDHLTVPMFKMLVEQQTIPSIIWGCMQNGKVLGLTYKQKEDISGWWRAFLGGSSVDTNNVTMPFGKCLWIGNMPRANGLDQVWYIAERVINGQTVRSVEYMEDYPDYPNANDFYSGNSEVAKAADNLAYQNALYEKQKTASHVDMGTLYDGSIVAGSPTVTPDAGALTQGATNVNFTASVNTFDATMVNREIWKKYDVNGNGGGRAQITSYVSPTVVQCTIKSKFDNNNLIPAGNWYLTAQNIFGLEYLNGVAATVSVDGGTHAGRTVANGSITLDYQASTVRVGYGYRGIIGSLNLDSGGVTGSAVDKPRIAAKIPFRFLNTSGIQFGTDPYKLEQMIFRDTENLLSRPVPLFSGIKRQAYSDKWERDGKQVYVVQNNPLPCTVLTTDIYMQTTDDQ